MHFVKPSITKRHFLRICSHSRCLDCRCLYSHCAKRSSLTQWSGTRRGLPIDPSASDDSPSAAKKLMHPWHPHRSGPWSATLNASDRYRMRLVAVASRSNTYDMSLDGPLGTDSSCSIDGDASPSPPPKRLMKLITIKTSSGLKNRSPLTSKKGETPAGVPSSDLDELVLISLMRVNTSRGLTF